ncbi:MULTISPECIES: hypothetical protein [unclassified Aurantimonas]|uniref:hypothetical protein n=1 Tax=unclassified Aurantimonas TaxID=2638230 RepID=UPI002E19B114|nr:MULTISPECIES: hypothetical protein [unclassified Aurantimonas]MEC5291573.1 hypothetical protein [Aurantimonas sp. C2-3-R2]MEC5412657.1 hypothetical protein [Aurantimonas sp. C2-4-R8]
MKTITLKIAEPNGDMHETARKIEAYSLGDIAVHRATSNRDRWIATHINSGCTITNGRSFPTRKQAVAFAKSMQSQLDFNLVRCAKTAAHDLGQQNVVEALIKAFTDAHAV